MSIYVNLFSWIPVSVTFILNQYYFDDAFFRMLFKYSMIISVAGVFVGYWVGIVFHLIGMDKLGAWNRWISWLILVANVLFTGGMMTYVVFMAPPIFRWIDKAPYGDKGAYNHETE